ncbi:MAG: hypothetical protein AB1416_12060, partial [Actinomycetota bacterium]
AVALARSARRPWPWRAAARAILAAELVAVVAVGTMSLAMPGLFPKATVWSAYGMGYGWLPLALPVLGLVALHRDPAVRYR